MYPTLHTAEAEVPVRSVRFARLQDPRRRRSGLHRSRQRVRERSSRQRFSKARLLRCSPNRLPPHDQRKRRYGPSVVGQRRGPVIDVLGWEELKCLDRTEAYLDRWAGTTLGRVLRKLPPSCLGDSTPPSKSQVSAGGGILYFI